MPRKFRDIEQVKSLLKSEKTFISLLESCGVYLERVNADLYKALCCFHRENTPSMMITPSKGLYHCFGCKAGGDEFEFLQKLYHISFIESIHKYAEIAEIDLSPYYQELSPEEKEKERLIGIMDSVVTSAQFALFQDANISKLQYLRSRGFTDDTLKELRIGYSSMPTSSNSPDIKALELDRTDVFYDALTFPDFDAYGRPVRFYGRPFTKRNEKDPKYIGTSKKSPLYEYTIYGFHLARKHIRDNDGKMIIVEGQADLAKMYQHGFRNTGSTKGTTFNDDTIKMLETFKVQEVILLYDGDDAGINATKQVVSRYLSSDRPKFRLRVANIYGYDPDEFLNAHGRDAMKTVLDRAVYAIEYVIDTAFRSKPSSTLTERMDILREIQPYVNNADQIEKKLAVADISARLNMDTVFVEDFFKSNDTVARFQLYSTEGERIVLAECIRNRDFIINISDRIRPEDFYLAKHRSLYQLLLEMCANRNIEISIETVVGEANNRGISSHFENGEYIRALAMVISTNVDWHVNDIEDKSTRRRVSFYTDELKGALNNLHVDAPQAIEIFNSKVTDVISNQSSDKVMDGSRQADAAMNIVMDRMMNPNTMVGYDLGPRLAALSQQLRGVQRKRLHTISANQGVGKSKLLAEMCTNIAIMDQVPLLWFSYEMAYDELTLRNLAILSGISQDKMMDGTLTLDEHDILQQWSLRIKQSPIFITDKGRDIQEALAIARKHILYDGVKVLAFDYIQLMRHSAAKGKRYEELGMISKSMKEFAGDMDVAVLNVAQLGKGAKKQELAQAEDVYGGYEIAQDSDVFITMQQKTDEQIQALGLQKGNLLIYLDKNRGRKDDQIYNAYAHDNNCRIQIV